jgi:hypothetical protein
MLSQSQLDERLREWTHEYGWGGLRGGIRGRNLLQRLIDHAGFVPERCNPTGRSHQTWGDEVEAVVADLQTAPPDPRDPGYTYRVAMALRVTHLGPSHWPPEERIAALRKVGVVISRASYYKLLEIGHMYLRASIRAREAAA